MNKLLISTLAIAASVFAVHSMVAQSTDSKMGFFLTSRGPGKGADLGGLSGADAHCKMLAEAAGVRGKTWAAYLSTSGGHGANARDRIGSGPWHNAKGIEVATNVAHLHSDNNNLTKETVLNEKGEVVNGRGDTPNRHDILTGTAKDGSAAKGDGDTTCNNWSSSGEGSALVGHHDRTGGGDDGSSWNAAHPSRGCSQENLQGTGGDGLFYCFATN